MAPNSHNRLIGTLLGLHGILYAALAVRIIFVIRNEIPLSGNLEQDQIPALFVTATTVALSLSALMFVLQIFAAIVVTRKADRGRNWGIFGSIVACLSGPLGIPIGIYGLWFFFGERGKSLYSANHSVSH